jgi:hypothetical protein
LQQYEEPPDYHKIIKLVAYNNNNNNDLLLCLSGLLYLADYLPFWRWVVDPYGCEIRGSMGAVLEKRVNDFHYMKNIDQEHRRERERKRILEKAGDR